MKIDMRMFLLVLLSSDMSFSWTIGSKGRVAGPAIHTTYFLTPMNAEVPVQALGLVGIWVNGICQYNATYPLGKEMLKTGDFVDIDGYLLRATVGGGYNCMTIYYTYKQLVIENFVLVWDGINYNTTIPFQDEVSII